MEKVKETMKAMGALPKLRLGEKLAGGGVKSFGPKEVTFVSEPVGVTKKDHKGRPKKMLKFEVEHKGERYFWYIPLLNEEGDSVSYLMERMADVKVGDTLVLEMMKQGAKNYIDVREPGQAPRVAEEDEGEEVIRYDEEDQHNAPQGEMPGLL